jgi:hypothetical protein
MGGGGRTDSVDPICWFWRWWTTSLWGAGNKLSSGPYRRSHPAKVALQPPCWTPDLQHCQAISMWLKTPGVVRVTLAFGNDCTTSELLIPELMQVLSSPGFSCLTHHACFLHIYTNILRCCSASPAQEPSSLPQISPWPCKAFSLPWFNTYSASPGRMGSCHCALSCPSWQPDLVTHTWQSPQEALPCPVLHPVLKCSLVCTHRHLEVKTLLLF